MVREQAELQKVACALDPRDHRHKVIIFVSHAKKPVLETADLNGSLRNETHYYPGLRLCYIEHLYSPAISLRSQQEGTQATLRGLPPE
jgi:hypothetical protein